MRSLCFLNVVIHVTVLVLVNSDESVKDDPEVHMNTVTIYFVFIPLVWLKTNVAIGLIDYQFRVISICQFLCTTISS